jgi:DNA-binding NarL/FixJ family response regulator
MPVERGNSSPGNPPQSAAQYPLPFHGNARDQQAGQSGKRAAEAARVLIVEDDFLVAMQAESALTAAGFAVTGVAASAEETIQMAELRPPALAVMDIRLAGDRDGIDAALVLFQNRGIRCIFATAHYDAATLNRAETAHPLGWLPKPYTPMTLIEMVRLALRDLDGHQS